MLVTERQRVRVPHQLVELHGAQVINAFGIVAPTVRADYGPGASGVARQLLKTRRWLEVARAVENPLRDDAGARGNTQAVKSAIGVGLARRAIAGDDAGHVRAMAVFIGCVCQTAIIKKSWCASEQIRVHAKGVAVVQAGIGHGYAHARSVVAERLGEQGLRPAVAGHDLRSHFIEELHVSRRLNPEHRVGLG